MNDTTSPSIQKLVKDYLDSKALSRSKATSDTYRYAMNRYIKVLETNGISPTSPCSDLPEQSMAWFLKDLKKNTIATEKLYVAAVTEFFGFLEASESKKVNTSQIRLLVRQHGRKQPERLYDYATEEVEKLLDFAWKLDGAPAQNDNDKLIDLRDRALMITLADTGLRINEACKLRRGDINRKTHQAAVIGKGNKEDIVRFSARSIKAIDDYLAARTVLMDGNSGKPLNSLPIFTRHDRGAGIRVKGLTTVAGRNILISRVAECLGDDFIGKITPHTLRHRFVTQILRSTNNLKLAKDLARHSNIAITQRYAHLTDVELDEGYRKAIEK